MAFINQAPILGKRADVKANKGVLHRLAEVGGTFAKVPPTHVFDEADTSTQNYWTSDPAIESLQPSGHFAPSLSL